MSILEKFSKHGEKNKFGSIRESENEFISEPEPESGNVTIVQTEFPTCLKCEQSEWWVSVYDSAGLNPACVICEPAPTKSLVGREWFFDEAGNEWLVIRDMDGERCERL